MGYVIKNVVIKNFKYIDSRKELVIEPEKADMVVLNGQNGYGKTTFFDSLELLFTSHISHMTAVANRQMGNEIEELAFDKTQDIFISAILVNEDGDTCSVKRVFKHDYDFESEIFLNDEKISSEFLQQKFGYDDNLYGMGIYMSQTKSLAFLEQKLKDRKNIVAELVNTKNMSEKVSVISSVTKGVKSKIEEKQEKYNDKVKEITEKIESLQKELELTSKNLQKEIQYSRLFPNMDYYFDKEIIDSTNSFTTIVEPLNQLKSFLQDYDGYVIKKQNNKINKALSYAKQVYLKKYYLPIVDEINAQISTINTINSAIKYKSEIDSGIYTVSEEVCAQIGINNDDLDLLSKKIEALKKFKESLGKNETAILGLNKLRTQIVSHYKCDVENGVINVNICPLCGASHKDIEDSFKHAEESLLSSITISNATKVELENDIKNSFNRIIVPALNSYLETNARLYNNYQQVSGCLELDIDNLSILLKEFSIQFDCAQKNVVEMDVFELEYEKVISILKSRIKEERSIISPETFEVFKRIELEYYNGQKPTHVVKDIDNKIGYIANCYSSETQKILQNLVERLAEVKKVRTEFISKSNELQKNMNALNKKYSDAQKDYQTKLVEAIRIPVLIYSGKIIQNYPLGLGIKTKIAANQLSFEPFEKEGSDVINLLSTGQLNGLAISIMLAIRSVYGKKEGLDFILIDDPLQTIDDISAISLADLLLNCDNTQVVISTHEDRKANMLGYKYLQRNLQYKEVNMKQKYLSYKKTEELSN